MSILRLIPPIHLLIPLGEGEAYFLDSPSSNDDYCVYGIFILETEENWWFDNTQVRLIGSITARRDDDCSPIYISDKLLTTLQPHILRHS
jgi:hypothetical protein